MNVFSRRKHNVKRYLSIGLISSALFLVGCHDTDEEVVELPPAPASALVQTTAPDYSSSEVAFLDIKEQNVAGDYYVKDKSDYSLVTNGGDIYHIGRSGIDTIEKYTNESRDEQVYSYTTQDSEDATTRNPYTMVFASDDKAYIIRYDSDKVWIVNPKAKNEQDFKIGQLDLSAYISPDNSKGTPSPSDAVISNGKLFISMQRMTDVWSPSTTYVAVFDVTTDKEIETNSNSDDELMGIMLAGINPQEHNIQTLDGKVYVTTGEAYFGTDLSNSKIEEIDSSTFAVRVVLDATAIADNESAKIKGSVFVSSTKAYLYASQSFTYPEPDVSTIYEFNPTTGKITANNVASSGIETISFIDLDSDNFLWISAVNPATPGVDVFDTLKKEMVGTRLLTELNPGTIRFLK